MSNVVVYTAIFGGYDSLYLPAVVGDAKYYCFHDTSCGISLPYQSKSILFLENNQLTSRYCKINSHLLFPDNDFTIWHGGNVQLLQSPDELIDCLGDADIATLVHSQRNCIYEEAEMCVRWKKDSPDTIRKQITRYRSEGFPAHNGLHAAFLIVRRNTDFVREFNEIWWNEVSNGSVRDQLSFDYVLWKMGDRAKGKLKDIPGDIFSGPYHKRYPIHKGEK